MMTKSSLKVAGTLSATVLLMSACGNGTDSANQSNDFEIFTWYTSGSEEAAKRVLFEGLEENAPDVEITDAAVAGAAGTNAQAVLQTRLRGQDLPSAWQTYAGAALDDYVNSGYVMDLTDMYEENGLLDRIPDAVREGLSVDGSIYGASAGVERGNMIWYNPQLISQADTDLSGETTFSDFIDLLQQLEEQDIQPICLGDTGGYGSRVLFESVMLSNLDADQWNGLFDGQVQWDDDEVTNALEAYLTVHSMANSDAEGLDWTDATRQLGDGDCAILAMGGWAYGELLNQGYEDGTDFDYIPMPGSGDVFDIIQDTFVIGQDTDPDLAQAWVQTLNDTETQLSFAAEKGSTPISTEADVSDLNPFVQESTADYQDDAIEKVYSLNGSSIAAPAVVQTFTDSIVSLNSSGDMSSFAEAMDGALTE